MPPLSLQGILVALTCTHILSGLPWGMRHLLVFLASVLLALTPVAAAEAILGEPFELRVGERVEVEGSELSLAFVRVDSDSRCPKDVICIWAGEAKLVFRARVGSSEEGELVLISPGEKARAAFGRYRIEVVALAPEPDSRRKIAPEDYVATLRVTEEQAEGGV